MKKKIVKVTAIVLLIGLLFSMASLVSAGFIQEIIFQENNDLMTTSSSSATGKGECNWHKNGTLHICSDCREMRYKYLCMGAGHPAHEKVECGCGTKPL